MIEAQGVNNRGMMEFVQEVNRAQGPRALDVEDVEIDGASRRVSREAAKAMMGNPNLVKDRTRLATPPALKVLSLGQSYSPRSWP